MNILLLSNSPKCGYGYSVVADYVAAGLQKAGHQVHFLGMQTIGPPVKDKDGIINLGVRYDAWVSDILGDLLRVYNIDILLTILDVWLDQTQYIPPLTKHLKIPLVSHITVNSSPLSPFLARFITQCNYLVAPSKFIIAEIENAGFKKDVYHISHGVDTNIFKPLPEDVKKEMRERLKIDDKKFVLLTVMRNKSPFQKDYAALFHAWKMMLSNHPELQKEGIILCLTDPNEPSGMRIDMLRDRVGLTNFVRFIWAKPSKDRSTLEATYEGDSKGLTHNANYNLSHSEMAKIYNIADAYVQASFGESFGLPVLESEACGVPQINADHTTGPELVGEPNAGLMADVKANLTTPLISDSWVIDPISLSKCIERMYLDKNFRESCSKNALKHAANYDWHTKIIPRWVDLFNAIKYLS